MIDKAEGYLQKLIYLQSKKMDFGYYFFAQKIKRIALWGVNKQSLSLSELLRESSLVELAGIYDKEAEVL